MVVGIAMEDEVCPPETSYAAYRLLNRRAGTVAVPQLGPRQRPRHIPGVKTAWLQQRIGVCVGVR